MDTKFCNKCKIEKAVTEFYKRKQKTGIFLHSICKECACKNRKRYFAELIKDKEKYREKLEKHNMFYYLVKANAKRRNINFELIKDDFKNLPNTCPIFNIPISYRHENRDNSISIDRIDNSIGYTKDNIVFISHRANRQKNDMSFNELEQMYLFYKNLKE